MNKLNKTVLSFLVVIITAVLPGTTCFAFEDGDVQFWSTASATFDINKDWKGKFEGVSVWRKCVNFLLQSFGFGVHLRRFG